MSAHPNARDDHGVYRLVAAPPGDDATVERSFIVGWLRLAVAALAVAGLFALLVAVARTPTVQRFVGEGYFRLSLVAHVTFSLNVWSLSFTAALWALALARLRLPINAPVARATLATACAGAVLMGVASVGGVGEPLLVDYIPILDHPLFIGGLGAFHIAVGIAAASFIVALRSASAPLPLYARALRLAAATYLMAMLTAAVAFEAGWSFDWPTLAWGPGHLLQVVNAASLVAAWTLMLPSRGEGPLALLTRAALPLFLLPAVVVPFLYLLPGPVLLGAMGAITWLGLTAPTVLAWLVAASAIVRGPRQGVPVVALGVSLVLFALGGIESLFGLEGDTRVTAHYHGTVGAVTVAYMGLTYQLLPMLGLRLRLSRLARLQPALYGLGLLFLIASLFWAASHGGQRKAFEAFAQYSGLFGPMTVFVVGAVLALLGGAAFVLSSGASLMAGTRQASPRGERYTEALRLPGVSGPGVRPGVERPVAAAGRAAQR